MASGIGIFFGIIFLLVALGGIGWVVYRHIRARSLGHDTPSFNPFARDPHSARSGGGVVGWISDRIAALKGGGGRARNNPRYAAGAYEQSGMGGGGGSSSSNRRRGGSTLDPDEAWDTRVGNEADAVYGYDEEHELDVRDPGSGMYASPPPPPGSGSGQRGRSRTRELDERYDEEMGGGRAGEDPFGDAAERSNLRGVSPRPVGAGGSPTESRRSMFRENV